MKDVKKLTQALLITAGTLASTASLAQVVVAGGSSTSYVTVGGSNSPQGTPGRAGISMPKVSPPTTNPDDQSFIVGFAEGPLAQTNNALNGLPGNGYITLPNGVKISETWKAIGPNNTEIYAYRQIGNPMPNFPHFGGEVVAKVSGNEVYFGEWAPKGNNTGEAHNPNLNMNSPLRTVFYVGENPTTSMPTLANAKYDVVGVSRYNPDTQAGVYTGVLTANYGGGSGTLSGNVGYVNFNGTTISSNGTFTGQNGRIEGRFYGAAAEALAGIYNRQNNRNDRGTALDMAFGGAKR